MGKKPKNPSPRSSNLEDLPQPQATWQVAARQMAATVRSGERSIRPWMVLVVSTNQIVLAFEVVQEEPNASAVQEVIQRAMTEPVEGDPHRPTTIQLADAGLAKGLKPFLTKAHVESEVVESLDHVDDVLKELNDQMPSMEDKEGTGLLGLLEMPGITPESAGSFFDAAAVYVEAAPWKKVGERTIRVASSKFESGPWYAVMMGQAGMTSGLVLYDSLATLREIQEGRLSEMENARRTAALAVLFGDKEDLPQADLEAAQRHGWRIAGPQAYPNVYRMNPGLAIRPPLAWELELLEGCLRALPEFVRKKTRRLTPLALTVPVASGDLPLELAWQD
jgi:hypothetical protein